MKEGQDEDLVRCLTIMGSQKEEQLLETVMRKARDDFILLSVRKRLEC